jgi:hypothetical protein
MDDKTMTRAEYRKLLNDRDDGTSPHHNNQYRQRTRKYGDYLYYQDRAKFEMEYREHLATNDTERK